MIILGTVTENDPEKIKSIGHIEYYEGMVLAEIPTLGVTNAPCRYGLSLPYLKVDIGQLLILSPINEDYNPLFYTGIADAGSTVIKDYKEPVLKGKSTVTYLRDLTDKIDEIIGVLGDIAKVAIDSTQTPIETKVVSLLRLLTLDTGKDVYDSLQSKDLYLEK